LPKHAFLISIVISFFLVTCTSQNDSSAKMPDNRHNLIFPKLADQWDEAIPLGNGMLGALVWQKDGKLRISLDRADLWDLRPVKEFDRPEFSYQWVHKQVLKKEYAPVQTLFDLPYDRDPAPTKIPAGALEFDISQLGHLTSVQLNIERAVCRIKWQNGTQFEIFLHATDPVGWFRWIGNNKPIKAEIVPPPYESQEPATNDIRNSLTGNDLRRLGYPAPDIRMVSDGMVYHQKGWADFGYDVAVKTDSWNEGAWSVVAYPSWNNLDSKAETIVNEAFDQGWINAYNSHVRYWHSYWSQSSISVPDSVLERQWYLEQYKFGATSRRGAPPISLQAVWTADNGRIPPWKGDFHHDLNTQLSYWPCYSSNHLEEGLAFLDWLWKIKPQAEVYTKDYYDSDGLNVPGVTTLNGSPMGGWIQYSLGPTVSAWLAHHFYLHWRYSMDEQFLAKRAYPWISQVACFIQDISIFSDDGLRKLPISSSPEINNNNIDAWFHETTNFDLALIRWIFAAAAELAGELDMDTEKVEWLKTLSEWPEFAIDPEEGLKFAPDYPYHKSHRHFSHLMAWHPLGLIDWNNGSTDQNIIENTIKNLERHGSDWWTGYSFSWLGNLYARARDGEKAAEALRTFAECFCLPNSFHVNGDQSGTGKSKFTYRPFTLEGNFAFASGIQEMLLQSHNGPIRIFPAVPEPWQNVSFQNLRTEGAFIVSAKMRDENIQTVDVFSEKGGLFRLINPFESEKIYLNGGPIDQNSLGNSIIKINTRPGQRFILTQN